MNLNRNQPRQRAAHATTRLAAVTLLLVGFAALRGHPVDAATQAATATIANPSTAQALESGGSATLFTVTLPTAAKCTGDTAKQGYHVYSYLVPKGKSVATVTFVNFPSDGFGFVDNTGTYVGPLNTANDTGQIIGIPNNLKWGPIVTSGGGTVELSTLLGNGSSATWEGGFVCATSSGTPLPPGTPPGTVIPPGTVSDWWGTDITFTASATDPGGFTWTAAAGTPVGGTTTTKPAVTTTTKRPVTTTTKPHTATTTTPTHSGGTTTTAGGATTTTAFANTGTTIPVTGSGTDSGGGVVYTNDPGTGGSLPRTGSPVHREVGIGLLAIGAGMMLLGLDLRWKLRGNVRDVIRASGTTLLSRPREPEPTNATRTVVAGAPIPVPEADRAAPDRRGFGGLGTVARTALLTLAFATLAFVLYLVVGTSLQHRAAQAGRFAHFRGQLAKGIAPISPVDADGRALALGTPIAVVRIPELGLRDVVGEGTTPGVLTSGPGHLRSTVFPGGAGTSVIFGRAGAYGGPFRDISHLGRGTRIEVTTGAGTSTFRVVGVRHAGDRIPALTAGRSRLTLVTASGTRFMPHGVVFVDADKVGAPLAVAPAPVNAVPASEQPLGTDKSTLFALVLWLQALLLIAIGAVWVWYHRSPAHAWLLFFAPAAFVATEVATQITHLLPNLL